MSPSDRPLTSRSLRVLIAAAAIGLFASAGCNKPRKLVLNQKQQQQVRDAVLTEAPTPKKAIGAILDGKIRLVGVDVDSLDVKAGEVFTVAWYWKSEAPTPGSWKIFVHFESPGKRRTTHDHHAVGELYPISNWKPGEIIRDVQQITVPKDFPNGRVKLHVGVFDEDAWTQRNQNIRMGVTNASDASVTVDKEGRIDALALRVIGGANAASAGKIDTRKRRYVAYQVSTPPIIDGHLEEDAWRRAQPTQPFVQPDGRSLSTKFLTRTKVLWDDTHLYVALNVTDDDIFNDLRGRDATLWKQDVVEIYLDPGADGKGYIELQVAPSGQVFDALFESRRVPDWPQAAEAFTLTGMQVAVVAQGTVNDRSGEPDQGWNVEVAIPWAEIPGVSAAPSDRTTWAANFYRIDVKTAERDGFMGAWSPAGGDFHNTNRFGSVTFRAAPLPAATRSPALKATPAAAAPVAPAVPAAEGEGPASPAGDGPVVPPGESEGPSAPTGGE
jgi:hypothetical protein